MVRRTVFVFVLLQAVIAAAAAAQTVWPPAVFVPAAPTELDRIRADFDVPQAPDSNTTTVAGTVVRTDVFLGPGVIGPPPVIVPYNAFFGPIAAGTYTYEIYLHYADGTVELRSRQSLVVSAAPALVPALSPAVLGLLVVSLAAAAVAVLGRTIE